MKCICGYERRSYDLGEDDTAINKDGPRFISLSGVFFREIHYKDRGYGGGDRAECYLYACPKCGTIQMEE